MAHKGIRGLYKRGRIWHMCYTPEGGRTIRKSTGKTKQEDALAVLDAVRLSINTGTYVPEEQRVLTLPHPWEIVCDSYLEDRGRRGKRLDSYRKLAAWREAFAGRDVAFVTLEDVERQLATWKDGKAWSPATYNNALATVSGVFSWAYRKGWIKQHPLRGRAERMQVSNERERYFLPHEIAAMRRTALALARLHRHPRTWLSDAIIGAAFTGLRRGNFCALRCADVRRDEREDLYLRVGREKNGEPIEKRLLGQLRQIVETRIKSATPAAFLFPGPYGARPPRERKDTSAPRALKRLRGNAYTSLGRYLPVVVAHVGKRHPDWNLRWGVKDDGVTFHSFRHAFASLQLNAGVPLDVVQKAGGWKTERMVKVYARRADEAVRAAEETLANVLQLHATTQSPANEKRNMSVAGEIA
jgi:integrase